ncbi:MAG: hypothetical protein KAX42_00865, partial [Sphaerotilus sp.]|nr:hypothetical protein [Sphaerotilus sp.]
AGTDFDRRIELVSILRDFGFGAMGPSIGGQPPRAITVQPPRPDRRHHEAAPTPPAPPGEVASAPRRSQRML